MSAAIIGRKVGMTRVYKEGVSVPVTVIAAGPCHISQIRTQEADGHSAVQLAFEDIKPRRSTQPLIGHDARAGLSPKRVHREFPVTAEEAEGYELGQAVTVEAFEGVLYVDVTGTSKGRGYAGTIRRHGFKGQLASHGVERKHRSPGSIGGHANNAGMSGGIKKGKKMPGQYGNVRVTTRNLDVIGIDKEKNLLLVKGPVPGPTDGLLLIRTAKRLYKSKQRIADEAAS